MGRMSIGTTHGYGFTSQTSRATFISVQSAKKTSHGRLENGAMSCANAGE